MKIICNDKYNLLEIEGSPNELGYAYYHKDTHSVTLDGEFSIEELEALIEYIKENAPKLR